MKVILLRYGEIHLKGQNRPFFERLLIKSIKEAMRSFENAKVDRQQGRYFVKGIADEDIDDNRVWEVLKEAQLDEFVRSLPEGLDTSIGERGIRISGGQRQRIGIARALFEDPEVLVLDEATSALDNDTEAAIMESINRLHGKKTLVIIAHRLQTIEKCDMVYRVEEGKISRER